MIKETQSSNGDTEIPCLFIKETVVRIIKKWIRKNSKVQLLLWNSFAGLLFHVWVGAENGL